MGTRTYCYTRGNVDDPARLIEMLGFALTLNVGVPVKLFVIMNILPFFLSFILPFFLPSSSFFSECILPVKLIVMVGFAQTFERRCVW